MSRLSKGLKERFSIFLIISVCVAFALPNTGLSQWSSEITQTVVSSAIPSNSNPNNGDQITVAINMDMTGMPAPNDNLGSFTATLNWDPTVLNFVSHGGILQGFVGVVNTTQAGSGMITFNGAKPLGSTGVFDVLVITFDVTGANGTSTVLDLNFSAMAAAFTFTDLLPFLTVNDGMVTVGMVPMNLPPQLTAIPNQTMDENTTLDVPVTATDPDTDNITLNVNSLPAFGSFTDNGDGTGTISFAPGFNDAGTYSMVEVIATDDGTPSMADTVYFDLMVNNVNRPPALTPISDQTMTENTTLDVPVSATDPDMDNITLSVVNLPSFGSFVDNGDGTGTISFAPMGGDAGVYPNIQVIADDFAPTLRGTAASDTVSFTLTVNPAVTGQVVSSAIPSNANPNSGDQITVAINFDMTGMAATPDSLLGSFTGTINWDPTVLSFVSHGGILQGFVGVVNTTQAGSGMITFNGANPSGVNGIFDVLVFTFDVTGAGGTSTALDLEYSAMAAALTFNDLLPFLTVNDGMVTVVGVPVNNPPQLTPISNQTMDENTTLDVPVAATDPDLDNITLSVNNLPAFGSFTDNGDGTGTISFAPGFNDAGTYSMIEVIATDDGTPPAADTVYFDLTVNDVNRAPTLTPIADQTMTENTTLDVPLSATDPDLDNLTLSANNLPAFGSLADNGDGTGMISFAPTSGDAGVYPNIQVIAADDGTPSLSDTVSFTLTVNQAGVAQVVSSAIPSNSTPNSGDQITVAINFDMTGMAGTPDTLLGSFTGTINWDPTVLSFNSHSGILQGYVGVVNTTQAGSGMITFNGAKPLGTSGIFDVLVITFDVAGAGGTSTVLDLEYSAMAAALTFTDLLPSLVINDGMVTVTGVPVNNPPQLTPIPDQTMTEGETLNVSVSATDPDLDNITLTVNNLPSFGNFTDNGDGTGTINFAPGFNDAGQYPNIMVVATDDGTPPAADTVSFMLTVLDSSITQDTDAPLCALTNIIPGPPKAIEITVQDTGSGLAQVNVVSASNANVSVPPFTSGTNSPVVITATKINQNQGSSVTLEVLDVAGNSTVCDPVYTTIAATIPDQFELMQNFPNPFNPSTTIHFNITEDLEGVNNVTLKVFDLTGREIKTLLNEAMQPGEYSVDWNGTNNRGQQVAGGVYLYRLVAGDFTSTKKMILMK